MKTKKELAKKSIDYYNKNKEKLSAYRKIRYLESKGIIVKAKEIKLEPMKRTLNINEILNTLRKDIKHELWNKSVRQWNTNDWKKFNLL
jgi:hypothetical protein